MAQQVDLTALTYVALKDMQINGVTRTAGSAVPEAGSWKNLNNYISQGYVAIVTQTTHNPGVPPTGTKAAREKVGKARGNAEFTHYQPVDFQGVPSIQATDAL